MQQRLSSPTSAIGTRLRRGRRRLGLWRRRGRIAACARGPKRVRHREGQGVRHRRVPEPPARRSAASCTERRADAVAARRTGLFDFRLGVDIHVLVGCGLGGGSLINAGVALKARRARLRRFLPGPRRCGVTDCSRSASHAPRRCYVPYASAQAATLTNFARSKRERGLGHAPVSAPVVVSFEDIVNPAGVAQPACTLCGDCCSGCNVGAKNTWR